MHYQTWTLRPCVSLHVLDPFTYVGIHVKAHVYVWEYVCVCVSCLLVGLFFMSSIFKESAKHMDTCLSFT